jgi:large subunit ribosomal protein L19
MKTHGYTKQTIAQFGIGKTKHPAFRAGDTIAVHQRIKEGDKERVQIFEGDVIKIRNCGASSTFTVRKMSDGVAVERIFPFASPLLKKIEVLKTGDVRRAKLYYVRERLGKSARIDEKIMTREQKEQQLADRESAAATTEKK